MVLQQTLMLVFWQINKEVNCNLFYLIGFLYKIIPFNY